MKFSVHYHQLEVFLWLKLTVFYLVRYLELKTFTEFGFHLLLQPREPLLASIPISKVLAVCTRYPLVCANTGLALKCVNTLN